MSALRLSTKAGVQFVDLGPGTAHTLPYGHFTGRMAVPSPGTPEEERRAKLREYQARHRAKRREVAA